MRVVDTEPRFRDRYALEPSESMIDTMTLSHALEY